MNFPSPFGGGDERFDSYDEFVPEHLPDPGPFLADHDVLTGDAHVAVHERTRELFDERGVYDMTFNYNLARLNLDTRHEDAGYRYAVERNTSSSRSGTGEDAEDVGERDVLRAEFTPTTPFCPGTPTLTVGSFRAWNAEPGRHDYDLVKVRVAPMHNDSEAINAGLAELEATFLETGEVPAAAGEDDVPSPTAAPGQVPEGSPF